MHKPRGIVALITILVFMAVLLSIGTTIALLGQDQIALAGVYSDGERAFAIADACTEEGYARLKTNVSFTTETFTLGGGTCTVVVTNLGGNNRLIDGTGTYNNSTRIVEANVTIKINAAGSAKKISINSWNEAN